MAKKRVILFGGSFNPPHQGHFNVCANAYNALHVDEVWMLVSPRNPFKNSALYADLPHRTQMCELMVKNTPWLKATDIEKNYIDPANDHIETVETLRHLRRDFPDHEFIWMMGSDNLETFHKWGSWQEIVSNHLIMVLNRTDTKQEFEALKHAPAMQQSHLGLYEHDKNKPFTKNRGFYLVDSPPYSLSSTEIRKNLAQKTPRLTGLFNNVADYIENEKLYNYGVPKPKKPQP